MKKLLTGWLFDTDKGEITFIDYNSIRIESILLIINSTKDVVMYNWCDYKLSGTVSGNVLTVDYDTRRMSNQDRLLIYYETPYDILTERKFKIKKLKEKMNG